MKQTSNAIKYLMAQYRAIFKRAFLAGFASTVALTAGLAASSANAAALSLDELAKDQTITHNDSTQKFVINAKNNSAWNADIIIKSTNTNHHYIDNDQATSDVTLAGSGSLTLDNNDTTEFLQISPLKAQHALTIDIKKVDVASGRLIFTNGIKTNSGAATLMADTINVGGKGLNSGSATAMFMVNGIADNGQRPSPSGANVVVGRDGSDNKPATVITVDKGGFAKFFSSGHHLNVKGAALNIKKDGTMMTSGLNSKRSITTLETDLTNVEQGGTWYVSSYTSHKSKTTEISGGLLVSGGNLEIQPNPEKDKDGKVINAGTFTLKSGSTTQIANQIILNAKYGNGGQFIVEDGATLVAQNGTTSTSGSIVVNGDKKTTDIKSLADLDLAPTFKISGDTLKSYLDGGKSYNHMSFNDTKYAMDPTSSKTSAKGAIVLKSGGVLDLSLSKENVDLSSFHYKTGTTPNAGYITIGDTDSGGYIVGKDLTVSSALNDGQARATFNGDLNIIAENLTLGDGKSQLSGSLGFNSVTATNSLTVNSSGAVTVAGYSLKSNAEDYFNPLANECDPLTKSDKLHEISNKGQGFTLGDTSKSGTITVEGGSWYSDEDITIVSGSITVESKTPDLTTNSKLPYGSPAVLTLNGDITFSGSANSGDAIAEAKGQDKASSVLDLTNATLKVDTTNGGQIKASGATTTLIKDLTDQKLKDYYTNNPDDVGIFRGGIGYGIVQLTGDQLDSIVNNTDVTDTASKVGIFIQDGGVVQIADSSSTFNMANFTSGSSASSGNVVFEDNKSGAYLDFGDGSLSLFGENASSALDISSGNIVAQSFSFKTYYNKSTDETLATASTIKNGNLYVGQSLSTENGQLVLGDGSSSKATLNLEAGESGSGSISIAKTKDSSGGLTVDGVLDIKSGSAINVDSGKWTAQGVDIKNAGTIKVKADTIFEADHYEGETIGNKTLTVSKDGSATFNTMGLGADHNLTVSGHLTINGRTNITSADDAAYAASGTNGVDFSTATATVSGAGAVLEFGKAATDGLLDVSKAGDKDQANGTLSFVDNGLEDATFNVDQFGQVKFNFADEKGQLQKLDQYDVKVLVDKILPSSTTGYLNLSGADLQITKTDRKDGFFDANWSDVSPFAQVLGHATTDELLRTVVTLDNSSNVRGHFAAFVQKQNGTLSIDGPTSLHHAAANGTNFVSNSNGDPGDVRLNANSALALANGGNIGSITGSASNPSNDVIDYDGTVVKDGLNSVFIYNETEGANNLTSVQGSIKGIHLLDIASDTDVADMVDVQTLKAHGQSQVTITNSLKAQNQYVFDNASVTAKNTTIEKQAVVFGKSITEEKLTVGKNNNHHNDELSVYGGEVSTADFTLFGDLNLGLYAQEKDDPTTDFVKEDQSYAGSFEATGTTILNDSYITLSTKDNAGVNFLSLNKLKGFSNTTPNKAGTLDGSALLHSNSVMGIGVENMTTLKSELDGFFNATDLVNDQAKTILYLGKSFTIGKDQHLVLAGQDGIEFSKYIQAVNNKTIGTDHITANCTYDINGGNVLYLGDGSTIVVSKAVADQANMSNQSYSAMISFEGNSTFNNGKGIVIADGGEIFVDGNIRASKYKVFDNATLEYLDLNPYSLDPTNNTNADKNILVSTANKFLNGYVDENGEVSLKVDPNARAYVSRASGPLFETLKAYANGYNGPEPTQAEIDADKDPNSIHKGVSEDRWLYTYNEDGTKNYKDYYNYFLSESISRGDGGSAETANRLGVFGGAAQVALLAGTTTSDAIAGRMGMSLAAAQLTQANNGQGSGMWVNPIYRSNDSDGFDANDKSYGVDADIYGVALGGDYTMSNGLRIGAMFNVGSGSADGSDSAQGVSNDFNYYGFGAYVGFSMDKFSVVGDLSYTVADNDVDATTSIEKISTSFDSTNLSLGVTGQYTFDLGNDVSVVPHAGLRFSRIDLDDYTVKGSSDVAYFNGDSLNVFSVPVGITFAKEYVGESWTVKPSLDITLTGNFGDNEVNGTTDWAGVENLVTPTSTEVLDSFTYGATLGVSAQSESFSFGVGLNYTGSSNTDEFGLNATARFLF